MGNCKDWAIDYEQTCSRVFMTDAEVNGADCALRVDAADDQGLVAYLVTGPMFGCVHFQTHD